MFNFLSARSIHSLKLKLTRSKYLVPAHLTRIDRHTSCQNMFGEKGLSQKDNHDFHSCRASKVRKNSNQLTGAQNQKQPAPDITDQISPVAKPQNACAAGVKKMVTEERK
ncbi:MAG: hypothetical protein RIB30_16805 [Thalassospira sp.]|uniref:hypothetical protein n=1 Tax=Thalassospira sp. TaxID=1912094 RepID=UPI0032EAB751